MSVKVKRHVVMPLCHPMGRRNAGIISDPKPTPGEHHNSMADWMSGHYQEQQTAWNIKPVVSVAICAKSVSESSKQK